MRQRRGRTTIPWSYLNWAMNCIKRSRSTYSWGDLSKKPARSCTKWMTSSPSTTSSRPSSSLSRNISASSSKSILVLHHKFPLTWRYSFLTFYSSTSSSTTRETHSRKSRTGINRTFKTPEKRSGLPSFFWKILMWLSCSFRRWSTLKTWTSSWVSSNSASLTCWVEIEIAKTVCWKGSRKIRKISFSSKSKRL